MTDIKLMNFDDFLKSGSASKTEDLFEEKTSDKMLTAQGHLTQATSHLQSKNTDGFHKSMTSYHTMMAKHHNGMFDHHMDASLAKAGRNSAESERHSSLAWNHAAAHDEHKSMAARHSEHLKAGSKSLHESFDGEILEFLESSKYLSEDAGAGAGVAGTSNSATQISNKPMPLGKLAKRKTSINEAAMKANPATRPPTAPSMSKSNDSLPDKKKSLGKLKEEVEAIDVSILNEDNSDMVAAAKNHLDKAKKSLLGAETATSPKEYHDHMSDHHMHMDNHHTVMQDHHDIKGGEAADEGDHKSEVFHNEQSKHHGDKMLHHITLTDQHSYNSRKLSENFERPPTAEFLNESVDHKASADRHLKVANKSAAKAESHLHYADRASGSEYHSHMVEHHDEMTLHHGAMADHHQHMAAHAAKENDHAGVQSHRAAMDAHDTKAQHHDNETSRHYKLSTGGPVMHEDLDESLLEDFHRAATYASVAAKHKFKVKSPSQTSDFSHEDHGAIKVNRNNDTWSHTPNGSRTAKTGKGAEELDSHLKSMTHKQVHM